MPGHSDLDASRFRIGRIERFIADQKAFIARTETRLAAARGNLTLLEATLAMAAKTHVLIEGAASFRTDLQAVQDSGSRT